MIRVFGGCFSKNSKTAVVCINILPSIVLMATADIPGKVIVLAMNFFSQLEPSPMTTAGTSGNCMPFSDNHSESSYLNSMLGSFLESMLLRGSALITKAPLVPCISWEVKKSPGRPNVQRRKKEPLFVLTITSASTPMVQRTFSITPNG